MEENQLYGIGKVEELCNLSKKAIRYYDKVGILLPDKISDHSGYRYYSKKTLLAVPLIKYYKQSGFKLEEMKSLLDGRDYSICEKSFRKKIDELKNQEEELRLKLNSINDWYKLILEAESIIENQATEVSIKYIEEKTLVYLEQNFQYNYMESIVNIEFTNYIESINNLIVGPVIIAFDSFDEQIKKKSKKVKVMQDTIYKIQEGKEIKFAGAMMASCYHIGSHNNINETYKKIKLWAEENNYNCLGKCYERYVTDYWTTIHEDKFVTEVIVEIKKRK